MSLTKYFRKEKHKYKKKGDLSEMSAEEILSLDPDDFGFYITEDTPGPGLNVEQRKALDNVVNYKRRAKKIGREKINREEEIKTHMLNEYYRKGLVSKMMEQYLLWKRRNNIPYIDLWNLLFGKPISNESIPEDKLEDFQRTLNRVLNIRYKIYPLTQYRQTPLPNPAINPTTDRNLIPDNEYYLTFSDRERDTRIVLKVEFLKYAEDVSPLQISEYENDFVDIIFENKNNVNASVKVVELLEADEYPYYFIPNENNPVYGYFRIISVVSLKNISLRDAYKELNSLTRVSAVPGIMDEQLFFPISDFSEEQNTLEWYFSPNNLIWVLLSPTENVLVSGILPPYTMATATSNETETEEEIIGTFLSTFTDYPDFIQFINEYLPELSPIEYSKYYSCLSPLYFTTKAPTGYDFLSAKKPPRELPFYHTLKYIFSLIPHFSPSTIEEGPHKFSEHTYMIYLNRLIYYYNIYLALSKNKLRGFDNTAILVIITHGSYLAFDNTIELKKKTPNIENLFICTKSPPGSYSLECAKTLSKNTYAKEGNLFDNLYDSMNAFRAISFDKIILETLRLKNRVVQANCWTETKQYGNSMLHYINPNTKTYINKLYEGSSLDHRDKIIDIQRFKEAEGDIQSRLNQSNILLDPNLLRVLGRKSYVNKDETNPGNIQKFRIELREILMYYNNKRGIQNLFVYDDSCGDLQNSEFFETFIKSNKGTIKTIEPEIFSRKINKMKKITKKLSESGLGKKKNKTKKRQSKRKNKSITITTRKNKILK